jgi:hypothetical protein
VVVNFLGLPLHQDLSDIPEEHGKRQAKPANQLVIVGIVIDRLPGIRRIV